MGSEMARKPRVTESFDPELAELPQQVRWREWMGRVEAVIFASAKPVGRGDLARVVGQECNLDLLIDDIRLELRERPFELVAVAGGWQLRTRMRFAPAIRLAIGLGPPTEKTLSHTESLVLLCIGYFQPITRTELGEVFGREVSRDTIGHLRRLGFIAAGPRSPQPGAPYSYVTTPEFLSHFGFDTLRDLPDYESLEDAGLLSKKHLLAGDLPALYSGVEIETSQSDDDDGSESAYEI